MKAWVKQKTVSSLGSRRARGFTIVELLIVIIVIGILATLVLVAYSNVSDQAKASATKNDLEQVAKQLNLYKENTGGGSSYPADTSSLSYSSGTTLQYSVNNAASPATYCVTATNGNTSYFVSNTSQTPTAGGCPGHGVNGVAPITNLATNPSGESNMNDWEFSSTAGSVTSGRIASGGTKGSAYGRITWTSDPGTGLTTWVAARATLPSTNAATYTASGYVRTSWSGAYFSMNAVPYTASSSYNGGEVYSTAGVIPANTWTRLSVTINVPAGSQYVMMRLRINGTGTYPTTGSSLDGDGFMLTSGSTLYNYADGSSPSWIWNGTAANATSSGPVL